MFLLRQELACLRDLPNIRGDYYRQRGRGGGRILIYQVSRNHIMVDNISEMLTTLAIYLVLNFNS